MHSRVREQFRPLPQPLARKDIVHQCVRIHGGSEGESEVWWGMTPKVGRGSEDPGAIVPAARSRLVASNFIRSPSRPSPIMPPRKKTKASAASTPLGDTQPKTPQDSGPVQAHDDVLNDAWADEQETQLFKSMMKWKPTGMIFRARDSGFN